MSVINYNRKHYQTYFNRKVIEYVKNNIDCDVAKYVSELEKSENLLKAIYDDVINLTDLVSKYDGYLYGGIVRSFLLRKEDTKDIDIWFTDKSKMSNFIKVLENKYSGFNFEPDKSKSTEDYRITYAITNQDSGFHYMLDLVLSDQYPVNDYDVNCLAFNGKFVAKKCIPINSILENISKKQMKKLSSFEDTTLNKYRDSKFRASGWTILKDDIKSETLGFFTLDYIYKM